MQKRDQLESMMRKLSDEEFAAIWKKTYGTLPQGSRATLVKDFVDEQYEGELDGCIEFAESLLTHTVKPKEKPKSKWLPPR
jgi:hypothetical protein